MEYKYVYGPVLSRRFGYSLGVDIIPYKTCSFDCIYCQLGKITNKTIEIKEYIKPSLVVEEIESALSEYHKIDYITFSGSGEPTLNSGISEMIKIIKKITDIPIVVLTNGSLFYQPEVIDSVINADIIAPSLDAGREKTFNIINRPYKEINFEKFIIGLINLRKKFSGKIYLEIMLVKNINDNVEEIESIKNYISKIDPDEVYLNTVVRPPAEEFAIPLNEKELTEIKNIIGDKCSIISDRIIHKTDSVSRYILNRIVDIIERRPVELKELSKIFSISESEVMKYIDILIKENKIKMIEYKGEKYYGTKSSF